MNATVKMIKKFFSGKEFFSEQDTECQQHSVNVCIKKGGDAKTFEIVCRGVVVHSAAKGFFDEATPGQQEAVKAELCKLMRFPKKRHAVVVHIGPAFGGNPFEATANVYAAFRGFRGLPDPEVEFTSNRPNACEIEVNGEMIHSNEKRQEGFIHKLSAEQVLKLEVALKKALDLHLIPEDAA